jgi:RNA polymerase sigma factor (sigma-70 family)
MTQPDNTRTPGPGAPTDEELIRKAQGGDLASTAALLECCRAPLRALVLWWAGRRGLRAEELAELRQEAAVGFLLAVAAYDGERRSASGPASFRTFLNQVVRAHLVNWDRQRRRAERHYDRSADWTAEMDLSALQASGDSFDPVTPDRRAADPADLALWQESWARLTAALRGLDTTQRWVVEQVAEGRSLHDLADERGLSYDRAKRLRRLVVAVLREAVR